MGLSRRDDHEFAAAAGQAGDRELRRLHRLHRRLPDGRAGRPRVSWIRSAAFRSLRRRKDLCPMS